MYSSLKGIEKLLGKFKEMLKIEKGNQRDIETL